MRKREEDDGEERKKKKRLRLYKCFFFLSFEQNKTNYILYSLLEHSLLALGWVVCFGNSQRMNIRVGLTTLRI